MILFFPKIYIFFLFRNLYNILKFILFIKIILFKKILHFLSKYNIIYNNKLIIINFISLIFYIFHLLFFYKKYNEIVYLFYAFELISFSLLNFYN